MNLGMTIASRPTVGVAEGRTAPRERVDETVSSRADKQAGPVPATASAELTPQQRQQVDQLVQIDRHVREHEQAHISAGRGVVTSGPNYSYTYGPDGKQYAVAGEVGIDTSADTEPQANIDKGQLIQAAALAPGDPSPQDYHVASIGAQLESRGRGDLSEQQAQQRVEHATQESARREEVQQKTVQRGEAGAILARQTGEAQNVEPKGPAADQNDVARQRVATAYQPEAVAAAKLSVFA